jgi:hypothetical protein
MGTRWRGLLAPIGVPTGDGRRFKAGGVTYRELPLGLKWQRSDEPGHDSSVIIGGVESVQFGTVAEAVENEWITADAAKASGLSDDTLGAWGAGELYDDVDRAAMPRLAEDVAEAMMLTQRGVIGPSVDAGQAEAILVEPGSDEPISEERWEELWDEAWENGTEPQVEVLFTEYEIAAATLVTIPAFAQCLPFVLDTTDDDAADGGEGGGESAEAVTAATGRARALIASAGPYGDAAMFADPELAGITAITITEPDDRGVRRVFGHVAAFGTCHTGIRDACTTPPTSAGQYASFHRYSTTAGGQSLPVAAGRITVAHGRLTGACSCCPGIDDHACNSMSMGQTIAHYDRATPVAFVRAGEDQFGIWVAGVISPDASDVDVAKLARQKVSGDWRDVAGNLELVEVLTLNREQPGFPLPRTALANGRQTSLVAAGAVSPTRTGRPPRPAAPTARTAGGAGIDYDRLAASVAGAVTTALGPLLPAGARVEYETTPLLDTPEAVTAADAPSDAVDATLYAAAAAAALADVDSSLYAIAAADATADLEGAITGV